MKRLLSILLILVLAVSVLLCSCNNDTPTETNTNTGSNTDTGTDTSKDTGSGTTDTDKTTDTEDNKKPPVDDPGSSFDAVIEHNLKVENSVKLDVFDSENTFGNEGNTVDYTNATAVDVSQLANNKTYTITLIFYTAC